MNRTFLASHFLTGPHGLPSPLLAILVAILVSLAKLSTRGPANTDTAAARAMGFAPL